MHISWRRADLGPLMTLGRITRRRAGLALCLALALGLSGCSAQIRLDDLGEAAGGDPKVAAGMVDRWFELAQSGEEDFGWWLLYPQSKSDVIGSVDVYRDALAGVDWSDFEYELGESRLHDGHYKIDVTIAGGEANVPEPLRRWGLI